MKRPWGGRRPGAGRPRTKAKTLTIALRPEEWQRVSAEAKRIRYKRSLARLPYSEAIRNLLTTFVPGSVSAVPTAGSASPNAGNRSGGGST